MPDTAGKFKGISVPRMWPGHPDYDPDDTRAKPQHTHLEEEDERAEREWERSSLV